ncbi:MAG: polyprenyl synthetase family protein [Oscillospiraceae bacterium]
MGKTVALIQAACTMGVTVGGGNDQEILAAKEYAVGVGMAFQIRDDILDVIGTLEALGKNVGVDAQNEKCNYVSLLGIEKATALVSEYTGRALTALTLFKGDTAVLREFARALAYREK